MDQLQEEGEPVPSLVSIRETAERHLVPLQTSLESICGLVVGTTEEASPGPLCEKCVDRALARGHTVATIAGTSWVNLRRLRRHG